jgi:hypothetical protein
VQALGQFPSDNPATVASKPMPATTCQLLVIQDFMVLASFSVVTMP